MVSITNLNCPFPNESHSSLKSVSLQRKLTCHCMIAGCQRNKRGKRNSRNKPRYIHMLLLYLSSTTNNCETQLSLIYLSLYLI